MTGVSHAGPQKRSDMMLDQPVSEAILKSAGPAIVASLITAIYNLADTYFVSALGTNATAAVSVNASLDQIIQVSGIMLAVGAGSYVSRLLGEERKDQAVRVLATSFFLAMACGAVIMALGTIFMQPMVHLLGATETCEQYAKDYATYVLLAAPFMASTFVMNQCLRAEGSAMLSMVGVGFGGVLNCILDPIFIFTLDLGVAGASMATAISKLVSFSILIFPYLSGRSLLPLSPRNFRPSVSILTEVITVGASSMIRSALAVVSAVVLNHIAGGISDSVLAGVGVCNKIMVFTFNIIYGMGVGLQPVIGFNWGAKRYDRVLESYRFAAWAATAGAAVIGLLLAVFARPLIGIFTTEDAEMMSVGVLCVRFQCVALPIHAWVSMVNAVCNGMGKAWGLLILATARQGTCFLPVAKPLALMFGTTGVAAVQAVADTLSWFLAIPIIHRIKREVNENMKKQQSLQREAGAAM